ncbi:PREDICTED: opioid growth factor receptor-like [Galeopterus variegatus]|uniref:Opioid growth factor receptor-like n=1 Tax=Galeopterus variegatus TaxID=482537 RepID=A0ABM0QS96_GALVR|nr:PREDICTED: opioid growth factor receptor-like [Galeopterus variegatus]
MGHLHDYKGFRKYHPKRGTGGVERSLSETLSLLSSGAGNGAVIFTESLDDERLWAAGPTSRETSTGTEMEHKNRGVCSNYGICCDTKDNLPPTAPSSRQSAQPTSGLHPKFASRPKVERRLLGQDFDRAAPQPNLRQGGALGCGCGSGAEAVWALAAAAAAFPPPRSQSISVQCQLPPPGRAGEKEGGPRIGCVLPGGPGPAAPPQPPLQHRGQRPARALRAKPSREEPCAPLRPPVRQPESGRSAPRRVLIPPASSPPARGGCLRPPGPSSKSKGRRARPPGGSPEDWMRLCQPRPKQGLAISSRPAG